MATSGEDLQVDGYEWERLPDMPTARVDSFGAYNKKKLYVLGKLVLIQDWLWLKAGGKFSNLGLKRKEGWGNV